MKSKFNLFLVDEPAELYNRDTFVKKYKKVASLLNKDIFLEEIFQNKLYAKEIKDNYIFNNTEQLDLYYTLNEIFDNYYSTKFFKTSNILDIAKDMFELGSKLPSKALHQNPDLESSGFISHLSHYVAFIHSLNQTSKNKIDSNFKTKSKNDLHFLLDTNKKHSTNLINELLNVYELINTLLIQNKIDFYSPFEVENVVIKIKNSSTRHQVVHKNAGLRNLILKDPTLCFTKWVLNVLYEKLLLMNFTPLDKFYMNYLISLARYGNEEMNIS